MLNIKKENVLIYPYIGECLSIVRYAKANNMWGNNIYLVAQKGIGIVGRDAGFLLNQPDIGINVSDDFQACLKNVNVVIITNNDKCEIQNEILIPNICFSLEQGKIVLCYANFSNEEKKVFKESEEKSKGKIYYLYKNKSIIEKELLEIKAPFLSKINTPVVFVGELYENLGTTEVCLSMLNKMNNEGYKVEAILKNDISDLIGLHKIPRFLFDGYGSETEKIIFFNNYIKEIERKHNADLIIIEIPNGMIKYNDKFTCGFGVIPFMISQSIQPDYFILCTQFDIVDLEFFEKINNLFNERFGFPIDCIHMSNASIDVDALENQDQISMMHHALCKVEAILSEEYCNSKIPIFNFLNIEDCVNACENMIEKLAE